MTINLANPAHVFLFTALLMGWTWYSGWIWENFKKERFFPECLIICFWLFMGLTCFISFLVIFTNGMIQDQP